MVLPCMSLVFLSGRAGAGEGGWGGPPPRKPPHGERPMSRDRFDREPVYVELEDVYIGAVTERAIQIHHDGEVFWVPKSVVQDPEQFEKWDEGCCVLVEEWFARKESLI